MRTRTMIVFVMLMISGSLYAQWYENGERVPDNAWRKGWGSYGAMLHITDEPEKLFAAWEKPGATVPLSITSVAVREKPVVGVVFFTGCETNDKGFCNSRVVFTLLRPDGEPYDEPMTGELWSGKPPPEPGQLQLSVGVFGVRIEPKDPDGEYVLRAQVTDLISGAQVMVQQSFTVGEVGIDDAEK